jgi:hypothetical protein
VFWETRQARNQKHPWHVFVFTLNAGYSCGTPFPLHVFPFIGFSYQDLSTLFLSLPLF